MPDRQIQISLPSNGILDRLREAKALARPGTHSEHRLVFRANSFGFRASYRLGALTSNEQSTAMSLQSRTTAGDYEYVVGAEKRL